MFLLSILFIDGIPSLFLWISKPSYWTLFWTLSAFLLYCARTLKNFELVGTELQFRPLKKKKWKHVGNTATWSLKATFYNNVKTKILLQFYSCAGFNSVGLLKEHWHRSKSVNKYYCMPSQYVLPSDRLRHLECRWRRYMLERQYQLTIDY